jgi:hypothetical protein
MMRTRRVTPNQTNISPEPAAWRGASARTVVIEAADTHAVMREQLEYLIDHAGSGICGCEQCQSYAVIRTTLMKMFADS